MAQSLKKPFLLAAMAVLVIVTIAIFFLLGVERTELRYWALFFVVLSEITLFSGLILINSKDNSSSSMFLASGITVCLVLHFVATMISSLYSAAYIDDINTLIIKEIVLIAVTALIVFALAAFSKHIKHSEASVVNNRAFIDGIEQRVRLLCMEEKNALHESLLIDLYEDIRHSDKSGSSMLDDKIEPLLLELENSVKSHTGVENSIKELMSVLTKRSSDIVLSKRGRI